MKITHFLFNTLVLSGIVSAGTILSRSFSSCSYLGGKIYCFGGDLSYSLTSNYQVDNNMYSLDITQFIGKGIETMNNQWETVAANNEFDPELRRNPTSIALSDGKTFLIQGGQNILLKKFVNKTIAFDTTTHTWLKRQPYTEGTSGTRQIYYSTAVNLPNNMVGFYGGVEQSANTSVIIKTTTGEIMNYDGSGGSYLGFADIKMYSSTLNSWGDLSPQFSIPVNFYPNSQSATINPSSGKIYYFGGNFYTPFSNGVSSPVPFSWGYTFNTKSGSWVNETFGGSIPSERVFHTTNLLPNSQDIILYGGSESGEKASTDYCFSLSLSTNEWTKHTNVNVPTDLSGPRFTHSAVLVDSILFILFGRGFDGSFSSSLLTIDVSSVTRIAYTSSYSLSNETIHDAAASNATNITESGINTGNQTKNSVETPSKNPSKLSAGVIGGIAAGVVVIILGMIAFLMWNRRRRNNDRNREAKDQQGLIHVDWDKIDTHYKDVTTPPTPDYQIATGTSSTTSKSGQLQQSNGSPSTMQHQYYNADVLGDNNTNQSSDSTKNIPKIHIAISVQATVNNSANTSIGNASVTNTNTTIVKPDEHIY